MEKKICNICKREFNNGIVLSNHKRIHSGKSNLGRKNGMWKGNKVGYLALHNYIKYHKKKSKLCEKCKKNKPYDLANISGEYKRDIKDFRWLCRKCHTKEHYPDGKWGKNCHKK